MARTLGLSRFARNWALRDELPTVQTALPPEDELLATALDQRMDARLAMLAVRAAEQEYRHQCLRAIPELTLNVDFERQVAVGHEFIEQRGMIALQAQGQQVSLPGNGRRLESAQIIDAVLGPSFTITVPVFDQNQAQIAKARLVARQRRHELEDVLDRVFDELQTALVTLRTAADLVTAYEREALPQARQNVDLARDLYRAGEQSIIVELDAQLILVRRERAYVDARRDYAVALAALEQALGGRVADVGSAASVEEEPIVAGALLLGGCTTDATATDWASTIQGFLADFLRQLLAAGLF